MASPLSWAVAAAARRRLSVDAAAPPQPTKVAVVRSVSNTGHQTTTADFNDDGSRVTVTSNSLQLLGFTRIIRTSVYDTNTGRQIGRTVTTRSPAQSSSTAGAAEAADDASSPVVTPEGSRALTITDLSTPTGYHATSVTVTDTATGLQVGDSVKLPGWPAPAPVWFGADGTHAIVTTQEYDGNTFGYIQMYSTIDTQTGAKAGTTLALKGSPDGAPTFSPDRERVVFYTYGGTGDTYQTQLGVLDTTTGAQIGSTLTYSSVGRRFSPNFSEDKNRVLMLAGATDPLGRYSIRASVVNTVTGTQIGKTLAFAGGNFGSTSVLSPDGAHALIVTVQANLFTLTSTTRVSILEIA